MKLLFATVFLACTTTFVAADDALRDQLTGIWSGAMKKISTGPRLKDWNRHWIVERNGDGRFRRLEFMVDPTKKVYCALTPKPEAGSWRLAEGGNLLTHQLDEGSTWSDVVQFEDSKIKWTKGSMSGPFVEWDCEELKLKEFSPPFAATYRRLTKEEFRSRNSVIPAQNPGPAAGPAAQPMLDEEVPWKGVIRRASLRQVIARIRGWAEASGYEHFEIRISPELGDKTIDRLIIRDDPRPTYREVLIEAFKECHVLISLAEAQDGIEVTFLSARLFRLDRIVGRLKRDSKWSTDALLKDMADKGWKFSQHLQINLIEASYTLVVQGTKKDLDNVARYLEQ